MSWGELLEIRDTGDGSGTLAKEGLFPAYVFKLGAANALGQTTPPTLTVNCDMVFNLTSNTNLRISVRGTDGVTRTTNLTLA